jgi:hypothetical protein
LLQVVREVMFSKSGHTFQKQIGEDFGANFGGTRSDVAF